MRDRILNRMLRGETLFASFSLEGPFIDQAWFFASDEVPVELVRDMVKDGLLYIDPKFRIGISCSFRLTKAGKAWARGKEKTAV